MFTETQRIGNKQKCLQQGSGWRSTNGRNLFPQCHLTTCREVQVHILQSQFCKATGIDVYIWLYEHEESHGSMHIGY